MEAYQASYVRAVAAAAGCVIGNLEIDEGIDITLRHTSAVHTIQGNIARLEVQLKATTTFNPHAQSLSVKMKGSRYNELVVAGPHVPAILVALAMPSDPADWTIASHESLAIHHCAYWVNLAGRSETTAEEKTVQVSKAQIFNDVALCQMMARIGAGDAP
jgi:hypothetical protein